MKAIYWLGFGALSFALSYLYHPNLSLWITQSIIAMALIALLTWSVKSSRGNDYWLVRVLILAAVASFMNTQALDVAYSVTASPLGNRFDFSFELIIGALFFAAASFASRSVFRPKKQI